MPNIQTMADPPARKSRARVPAHATGNTTAAVPQNLRTKDNDTAVSETLLDRPASCAIDRSRPNADDEHNQQEVDHKPATPAAAAVRRAPPRSPPVLGSGQTGGQQQRGDGAYKVPRQQAESPIAPHFGSTHRLMPVRRTLRHVCTVDKCRPSVPQWGAGQWRWPPPKSRCAG